MNDIFKEQLVKRHIKPKDFAPKVAILAGALIPMFIIFVFVPTLLIMLIAIYAFLSYIIMSTVKVEYEYALTNSDLDIDIIYNKTKRKKVFSGNLRDFELMAHIDDKSHEGAFNTATKEKDFSSGIQNENTYVFLTIYNGQKTKFIVEPDEMFLQAISRALPRTKLYIKK